MKVRRSFVRLADPRASARRDSAVVVAVAGVRVVQVPGDEVVDMIAVRDRLVTATGAVDMALGVTGAAVRRRARSGVGGANLDSALIHVAVMAAVEMAVVEVVDVIAVADREMPAIGAVNVIVIGVSVVAHEVLFRWDGEATIAGSPA